MKKVYFAVLLAVGAIAAGMVATGVFAGRDTPPPPPVDLPAYIGVADENGNAIRCPDGKLLKVRSDFEPPPAPRAGDVPAPGVEMVPRCGPRGGDGPPVWVELKRSGRD